MKNTIIKVLLICYVLISSGSPVFNQKTPDNREYSLREQVLLNGIWDFTPGGGAKTTIPVPEFWGARTGFRCDEAAYERQVLVPASWTDKLIKVEFTAVQFIAGSI